MSRLPHLGWMLLCVTLAMAAGCHPQQPFFFHETGDLSHYRGVATEIEYPDAKVESLGEVAGASAPLTLSNPEPREIWDLSLEEAMHIALANAKVMKQLGAAAINNAGTSGPNAPSFLTNNPSAAASVYDPALIETDGRTGVEAALAAFDAQLTANMSWQRVDMPQNYTGEPIDLGDAATFQSSLSKTTATGGTVAVNTNVGYQLATTPTLLTPQIFPGAYTTTVEFAATQPLLQGAGVTFNQIAGPGGLPGFNNGVLIARINTDIALATFEANIRNMVADVETAYWELYFSYRNLDAVVAGRNAALSTWRRIYALAVVGARGGEAEKEAQAREQYFLFRSSVEQSLGALYKAESNMRYMMGLATSDGRLIRPKDEPTTARVAFDWYQIHCEALARNPELREQKWTVKRRELELVAAKNYLLPRLDAVAKYDFLGMGQNLVSASSQLDTANPAGTNYAGREGYAINNLLMGDYQEWTLGFEFKMPLGFRKEMANVRNAELRLTRERAVLQEQELELSHQLGFTIRDLDANYVLSESDFNRRVASQREVDAVQAAYDTGTITLDVLLLAQRNLFQAESDYYRAVVDYNKSIIQVHLRKGSLLEYNGIYLAEGPWPGKAYFDATKLARARSAGIYLDYGYTRPGVVSRGPVNQKAGQETAAVAVPTPAQPPVGGNPEVVAPPLPDVPAAEGPQPPAPAAKEIGPQAGGPAMNRPLAAVTSPWAVGTTAEQRTVKNYDAVAANAGGRWSPAAAATAVPDGGWKVRQVAYQEPVPARQNATTVDSGNTASNATKANPGDESLPYSPFADSDRTAAGWKGAQH